MASLQGSMCLVVTIMELCLPDLPISQMWILVCVLITWSL